MAKRKGGGRSDPVKDWNRFVSEALVCGDDTNVSLEFKQLTKRYGLSYINYLKAAWQANDGCLSEEEFCQINGKVPLGFFNNKVKS